jgi:anti-sigma B factor antagonist
MDWHLSRSGDRLVGRPTGRVDESNWEQFSEALIAAVRDAAAGEAALVIDLSGLDYMSSRGLRALTMAKREGGEAVAITLAAPNARMREILAISRYDKLFAIIDAVGPEA